MAIPVLYECVVCSSKVIATGDFVGASIPATCSVCLRSVWLVRPEPGGKVIAVVATPGAEEMTALLEAEAKDAERHARRKLAEAREPTPEWN